MACDQIQLNAKPPIADAVDAFPVPPLPTLEVTCGQFLWMLMAIVCL
jgi:hypothetical protein